MCVQPTSRPTIALDTGWAITQAWRIYNHILSLFIASRSPQCIADRCQPPIGLCLGASSWLETFKLELHCNLLSLRANGDSIAIRKWAPTDKTLTRCNLPVNVVPFKLQQPVHCIGFPSVSAMARRFTGGKLCWDYCWDTQQTLTKTGGSHWHIYVKHSFTSLLTAAIRQNTPFKVNEHAISIKQNVPRLTCQIPTGKK